MSHQAAAAKLLPTVRGLSTAALGALIVATHAMAGGATTCMQTDAPAPVIATFTGDFVDGAPVYRLPALAVVASRKPGTARMKREEQLVRAKSAPSKGTAKPSV